MSDPSFSSNLHQRIKIQVVRLNKVKSRKDHRSAQELLTIGRRGVENLSLSYMYVTSVMVPSL